MKRLDSTDRFEIKARAFRRATGHWPPGKDAPLGKLTESEAEAGRLAWNIWNRDNGDLVNHVLDAVDAYASETGD